MMQKIDTMIGTSQIIWGLKPPFSVNSAHSVQSGQSVHSVQPVQQVPRFTWYKGYDGPFLLLTIAVVERRFFDIHFITSYIKAHNTCSDDIEDTHKA